MVAGSRVPIIEWSRAEFGPDCCNVLGDCHLSSNARKSSRDPDQPARVIIVDDHPIVRKGLAQLINDESDLHVCAEAATPQEALEEIGNSRADVAVVDLSLGQDSGLELIKDIRVRYPDLPVLVLSMHDESLYADRVMRAGAMGYIMKDEASDRVIGAIRLVLGGEVYLSEALSSAMLRRMARRSEEPVRSPIERLSDRELEVLRLIGKGLGTRQVAESLHLSVKTIENHREHIKEKLDLASSVELMRLAIQLELEGKI
jgi:DNA-binding NarL/FixJ family response regulator